MTGSAQFLWFWTFWRWSGESYRAGVLLRDPLHGLSGNWDTWFRHETADEDRHLIAEIGHDEKIQRQFIAWIYRHWAHEADHSGSRLLARFVLTQLSRVSPYNSWPSFRKYESDYGTYGVSAIVLSQGSAGEPEDVREMEALALPDFSGGAGPKLTSEGFQADAADLNAPRQAAMGTFGGRGLIILFSNWMFSGVRPHPRWLNITLSLGWLVEVALIVFLLIGPDPGDVLPEYGAALLALWAGLTAAALVTLGIEAVRLRREGKNWAARLERSQIWLRMAGGLSLRGGSAGLAFCLNILLAIYRAHSIKPSQSWIWKNIFHKLSSEGRQWAATGVIGVDGRLNTVVLEPKLRACIQKPEVHHILTPNQRRTSREGIKQRDSTSLKVRTRTINPLMSSHVGYAAVSSGLFLHPCSHIARALISLSGLGSFWQGVVTTLAGAVTLTLFFAFQDLRCILVPPPAPAPIALSAPPPNVLWVGLRTDYPEYFQVVLESDHWVNRRAAMEVRRSPSVSVRAEIPLTVASHPIMSDSSDGTVWIERRPKFLGRKFLFGERVGQYSVSYLSRLGQ